VAQINKESRFFK